MTISAWALLLGAIALEVFSTSLLNASQGMTRWGAVRPIRTNLCLTDSGQATGSFSL